jgi:uncharacterized protein (TIGR02453 family)
MLDFTGFPEAALAFYDGISAHNNREWFQKRRTDYMSHVVEPAQAFIRTIGPELQLLSAGVQFDPNHTGRGSFKKIHTDQRFQKGRDPFKTYCQIFFWEGPHKTKKSNSAFMLHFDPEKVALAVGLKYFDGSNVLKGYRNAVIDKKRGSALASVVSELKSAGYELGDQHYKRIPRGYDPEHKNGDLLRYNAIYAYRSEPVPNEFFGVDFLEYCMGHYRSMAPLHAWCVDLLGSL